MIFQHITLKRGMVSLATIYVCQCEDSERVSEKVSEDSEKNSDNWQDSENFSTISKILFHEGEIMVSQQLYCKELSA
jgi:hypothetical protein